MQFIKKIIRKIVPYFLISAYHFILAFLGAFIYGFPSRKLKVIGVTGTNGKSTVVNLATKILEEAGFKVASISSIRFKIGEREWLNTLKMTMPGRLKIQKFLKEALRQSCQYVVLEVTSEGIKQHRHRFVNFHTAVLTNLTPEHIESHGSFEKYKEAKGKLFQKAEDIHIINLDDKNVEYFLKFPSSQKFCYSLNENSHIESLKIDCQLVKAANIKISDKGLEFNVGKIRFYLKLLGSFNVYNALAAICIGLSENIDLEIAKKALEKIESVPGRMEIIIDNPFTVIVDYAHTPDSLQKVYQTLKNLKIKAGRMIGVLGAAGGGRDKWKRPEMGKIAFQYCDYIILTNEDPYDENPLLILEDIEKGFSQIPNSQFQIPKYEKILDRREAIKKALSLARENDIVIITGKGAEPWMCLAHDKKIPWDDREIVREEFRKL